MARLFYGMNASLDGFVDHDRFGPGPTLFQHFIDQTRGLAGSLYGRGLYDLMRYWDDDQPGWDAPERAFAQAWRANPKWVVSRTLPAVGANATLAPDLEATARSLKTEIAGEIEVGGPKLAASLFALGLIDEVRLYLHPVVLGRGAPMFPGVQPTLHLTDAEPVGDDVMLLRYAVV